MSVSTEPPTGRGFIIAAFVVAAAVGLLIAYFGVSGSLGAGIP